MEKHNPPSLRWTSYENWRYNGMDLRLSRFMNALNKMVLVKHTRRIMDDKTFVMSEPFSAGQYWCCFEMISETGKLVIARVRLPRHPDVSVRVDTISEAYSMQCEIATMQYLQDRPGISLPRVYAYEDSNSGLCAEVGAPYMLIEGFYGNTLDNVAFHLCSLSEDKQRHVFRQWVEVQFRLAAISFPIIGSISDMSEGEPKVGMLSMAVMEGMKSAGPFTDAHEYFKVLSDAKVWEACEDDEDASVERDASQNSTDPPETDFGKLGLFIFRDIVHNTELFKGPNRFGPFPLNHMDIGTQNILVDDDLNFLAIIDWEFAQSAPLEVNHYPMPFPRLESEASIASILADPHHIAYKNITRQVASQKLYKTIWSELENEKGSPWGISEILDSPASRVFSLSEKVGSFGDESAEIFTYEIVRLAIGIEGNDAQQYIKEKQRELKKYLRTRLESSN